MPLTILGLVLLGVVAGHARGTGWDRNDTHFPSQFRATFQLAAMGPIMGGISG